MYTANDICLVEMLAARAAAQPDGRAFVALGEDNGEQEVLTWSELDRRARQLAAVMLETAAPGDRAMLVFPTCLSFVVSWFACLYSGVVAVPMLPPRGRRLRDAVLSVATDCQPRLCLTLAATRDFAVAQFGEVPDLGEIRFIAVDDLDPAAAAGFVPQRRPPESLVFLQYTSGSTSAPKGVMVSHGNLVANLEMQRIAFANDAASTYVGWAPLYHDMGLIANVLEPFYVGALSVLMAPASFAQRPWHWLQAITRYRAQVSGGPNFAYDLCVDRAARILREDLDLSCWRAAFNSAEPVHARTLDAFTRTFAPVGFRADAFYPCYGMAEATLLISGGPPHRPPVVRTLSKAGLGADRAELPADAADATAAVGCGHALSGELIRIVDPATAIICPDGHVGEIWVSGPHLPEGYWRKPAESDETFHARLTPLPGRRWLRTGDLGFIMDNDLYITGRLKDLLIIRGRNYYPQDIERIAEAAHDGLRRGSSAAFLVDGDGGAELVLVQEVERVGRHSLDVRAVTMAIRQAVFQEFELTLHAVVLIAPGAVPKTSSGKIRRAETRRRYLAGELPRLQSDGVRAGATVSAAAGG